MHTAKHDELRDWLCAYMTTELGLPVGSIDPAAPMSAYGLDSIMAITMLTSVQGHVGFEVDPNALWEHPTVDAFAAMLAGESERITTG